MSIFSLGSTRFLKVARAKTPEGQLVVKVFVIHDPTLSLKPYEQQANGKTVSKSNLCSASCISITDKLMCAYCLHFLSELLSITERWIY